MKLKYGLVCLLTAGMLFGNPLLLGTGWKGKDKGKDHGHRGPRVKILGAEPDLGAEPPIMVISGINFSHNYDFHGKVKLFVPTQGICRLDVLDFDPHVDLEKENQPKIQEIIVELTDDIFAGNFLLKVWVPGCDGHRKGKGHDDHGKGKGHGKDKDKDGHRRGGDALFIVTFDEDSGLPGPPGPIGAQGPTGADGADGTTGPQGPTGAGGADGTTGPQGETGPKGATGPTGPTGPTGTTGAPGLDGTDGVEYGWR